MLGSREEDQLGRAAGFSHPTERARTRCRAPALQEADDSGGGVRVVVREDRLHAGDGILQPVQRRGLC